MEVAYMRFCKKPFADNLTSLSISGTKDIKKIRLCGGENVIQNFGRRPRVISGCGELHPPAAEKEMRRMRGMFSAGDRGVLVIPGYEPFFAVLNSLVFEAREDGAAVNYSFEFCEIERGKKSSEICLYHKASENDNLFTIARQYSSSVEELLRLNPGVARPDRLAAGEEICVLWR